MKTIDDNHIQPQNSVKVWYFHEAQNLEMGRIAHVNKRCSIMVTPWRSLPRRWCRACRGNRGLRRSSLRYGCLPPAGIARLWVVLFHLLTSVSHLYLVNPNYSFLFGMLSHLLPCWADSKFFFSKLDISLTVSWYLKPS